MVSGITIGGISLSHMFLVAVRSGVGLRLALHIGGLSLVRVVDGLGFHNFALGVGSG